MACSSVLEFKTFLEVWWCDKTGGTSGILTGEINEQNSLWFSLGLKIHVEFGGGRNLVHITAKTEKPIYICLFKYKFHAGFPSFFVACYTFASNKFDP